MLKHAVYILAIAGFMSWPPSASTGNDKEDEYTAPREAKTTAEIVKAVEAIHRKLMGSVGGEPNVSTAEFGGRTKVFVAWHSPFSGVKGCCAYLFRFDESKRVWKREMSKTFDGTNGVSVEFDNEKVTLRNEGGKRVYVFPLVAKAVDPNTIKDKVSILLGKEIAVDFQRDGDRLRQPKQRQEPADKSAAVKIGLKVTTDSPIPPPRDGATRPFLSVENGFEKSLRFRALVRMKGSKEFVELIDERELLSAGETLLKCWGFETIVEEVVLFDFKLSDEKSE